MSMTSLGWGSPQWMTTAWALLGVAAAVIFLSYSRATTSRSVKIAAAILKALGFTALAISLLDPLLIRTRPRRGANAFAILADNSQSLRIRDDSTNKTRGDWLKETLRRETPWRTRLGQDYDVRSYVFDTHLRGVEGFETLTFDGSGTSLSASLSALSKRFQGLPLAGVFLFTDGNRTDLDDIDWTSGPPIYPVVPPRAGVGRDVGVGQLSISQTNFESAPAVIRADVFAAGLAGKPIVAVLEDITGKALERQQLNATGDGKALNFRFQFRPEKKGINFYKVHAFAATSETSTGPADSSDANADEQTLDNNSRLAVIDQGGGPYRVLYVSGRPNWEFKFLRRALEDDDQIQLSGLVRVARKQPKFDFRSQRGQSTSPLFDGFDLPDADTAERADEAVLIGLGKRLDDSDQKPRFPQTADQLYRFHAIIVDDIEAGFFNADQLTLLRNFVSQRGGGLLMLGGSDSFVSGKYNHTPVGDLLPVYLNRSETSPDGEQYRLVLTREGWLQPWVRLRKTEDEERQRLAGMTPFETLSRAGEIKPGAVVLAEVTDSTGANVPALVAQQFGKGHVGALMIGDMYRWGMHRENPEESDLDRSWRQTVRWLVGDVPGRVDISVRPRSDSSAPAIDVAVRVRDADYRPLDNAKVAVRMTTPGGAPISIDAEPDPREPGSYLAHYVTTQPGPVQILATATAPDGSAVGDREAGWAAQPAADEFARLQPDREFLKSIAARTGGSIVESENLAEFVARLPADKAVITETFSSQLWHNPLYFLIAIGCLAAEWGLRRLNGLA